MKKWLKILWPPALFFIVAIGITQWFYITELNDDYMVWVGFGIGIVTALWVLWVLSRELEYKE